MNNPTPLSEPTSQPTAAPLFTHRKLLRRAALLGIALALLSSAYLAGYHEGQSAGIMTESSVSPKDAVFVQTGNPDHTIDFSLFWRVWDILKEKYVDRANLDAKKLFYGAIDGMLAATGDPYTTFLSPKEKRELQEDLSGSFEGIGAEMGIKNEILTIIAPLDGSPAQKAGLLAGDKVIKIDGIVTTSLSLEEAVDHIRGPRGTSVVLTIFRAGDEAPQDITVQRDTIVVKSVKLDLRSDGVALLRVSQFGEDTQVEFDQAIAAIGKAQSTAVILDLRNNSGGLLDAAVDMAHHFLPDKTVVVQEERSDGSRISLTSRGKPTLLDVPVIVLINEGSASAAEILAAALHESRSGVTLVGKTSFGKGSVQEVIPVSQDTAVKITVARWLTPDGHQINMTGIKPDIEVSLTRDDVENGRDPQLDRALEIVKQKRGQ